MILFTLIAVAAFMIVSMMAACRVASIVDEQMERTLRIAGEQPKQESQSTALTEEG